MFKVNRLKQTTLLFFTGLGLSLTSFAEVEADLSPAVKAKIKQCKNAEGTYTKTEVKRTFVSDDKKGKKVEKVCYDIHCIDFVDGDVDLSDPDELAAYRARQQGAFTEAWGKNICGREVTTYSVQRDDILGEDEDRSRGGGSASGSGDLENGNSKSYTIIWGSKSFKCRGETAYECLKRNGQNIDALELSFTMMGGGDVIKVTTGSTTNSRTGGRIVVSNEVGAKCYAYERVWWKLWLGKSWVEKDHCRGAGSSTSVGTDIAIATDLDRDGGSGSSGRSTPQTTRYEDDAYYWLITDSGRRIKCLEEFDQDECLEDYYNSTRVSIDTREDGCASCREGSGSSSSGNNGSSTAENIWAFGTAASSILGAVAPSYFSYKSNKAWANACSSVQNNFIDGYTTTLNYASDNEISLSDTFATDYYSNMPSGCNGYSAGTYAGMLGYTGTGYGTYSNALLSSGYTSPYLASMYGSYGTGNYGLYNDVTGGLGLTGNIGLSGYGLTGYGTTGLTGYSGLTGYGRTGILGLTGSATLGAAGMSSLLSSGTTSASVCLSIYASAYPQCSSTATGTVPSILGNYYSSGSPYGIYNSGTSTSALGYLNSSLYSPLNLSASFSYGF